MKTCYVCEYGWIVIGEESFRTTDTIMLNDAAVVRKWTNGKGIGGIAKAENKGEYTLDAIGNVKINSDKVLFKILCEW